MGAGRLWEGDNIVAEAKMKRICGALFKFWGFQSFCKASAVFNSLRAVQKVFPEPQFSFKIDFAASRLTKSSS